MLLKFQILFSGMPVRRKRCKKVQSSSGRSSFDDCASSKRRRAIFSPAQINRLCTEYALSRYVSPGRRKSLADQLDVTELQVKVWFQNQRAKHKRSVRRLATLSSSAAAAEKAAEFSMSSLSCSSLLSPISWVEDCL